MKSLRTVRGIYLLCALIVMSTSAGCIAAEIPINASLEPPPQVLLDVPFVKQKPYYCAPAAAEMVLLYHGIHSINQEDIATCDSDNKTGTHWRKLVSYIKKYGETYGITAETIYGDIDLLKKYLASGYPILVRQWRNEKKGTKHYRVVVGYDMQEQLVIFHDPQKKPSMSMSYERFIRLWDIKSNSEKWTSRNLMVVIGKKPGE